MILATNIAETSITIPGVRYVVDPGFVKARGYNARLGSDSLQVRWDALPVSERSLHGRKDFARMLMLPVHNNTRLVCLYAMLNLAVGSCVVVEVWINSVQLWMSAGGRLSPSHRRRRASAAAVQASGLAPPQREAACRNECLPCLTATPPCYAALVQSFGF